MKTHLVVGLLVSALLILIASTPVDASSTGSIDVDSLMLVQQPLIPQYVIVDLSQTGGIVPPTKANTGLGDVFVIGLAAAVLVAIFRWRPKGK